MKDRNRYNLISFYLVNFMLLFLMVICGGILVLTYFEDQALEGHGITTQATVLDLFTTTNTAKNGSKSLNYQIVYQFYPQNVTKAQFITTQITAETYAQLHKDSTIAVRYLPENPGIVRIMGDGQDQNFRNLLLIIGMVSTFAWIGVIWTIVKRHRERRRAYFSDFQAAQYRKFNRQNFH